MPTYLYFCEACNKEFEEYHSIKDELKECPKCKLEERPAIPPKKLINGSSFILLGNCWGKDNYSK